MSTTLIYDDHVHEEDDVQEGDDDDDLILFSKLSHRQIPSIAPPCKAAYLSIIIRIQKCCKSQECIMII